MVKGITVFRLFERMSWIVGLGLLAFYLIVRADSEVGSQAALAAFEANRATTIAAAPESGSVAAPVMAAVVARMPDQTLWSDARKKAYRDSLQHDSGLPQAVLEIPSLGLKVPVFEGTDEIALNRGVGRIEGTSLPGETGNIGIAGHRDGFFRGLKDIGVGESIELQTLDDKLEFRVSEITIVDPNEVSVLDPTESTTLTLVTCYPFYYVGHAPRRYIVRGVLTAP